MSCSVLRPRRNQVNYKGPARRGLLWPANCTKLYQIVTALCRDVARWLKKNQTVVVPLDVTP